MLCIILYIDEQYTNFNVSLYYYVCVVAYLLCVLCVARLFRAPLHLLRERDVFPGTCFVCITRGMCLIYIPFYSFVFFVLFWNFVVYVDDDDVDVFFLSVS
uniref:Uncharacterized protein n=1 Tax=Cacopsylla melanoneura TaxID=428564 RepID=A0A8D9BH99_9HEMI